MNQEKIQIPVRLDLVCNSFLLHLKEVVDFVTFFYHSIDNELFDIKKPLPSDSFPLKIVSDKHVKSSREKKNSAKLWLMQKGFEELIIGLNKSLIETYKILELFHLSQDGVSYNSRNELYEQIDKLQIDGDKMHFPTLITKIESKFGNKLYLRDEILSINNVRNCLVHGNGIVRTNDLKPDRLTLLAISLKWYTKRNGEEIELDYNTRNSGITIDNLKFNNSQIKLEFKLGENVEIDVNLFNDVFWTCSVFVLDIFDRIQKIIKPRHNKK